MRRHPAIPYVLPFAVFIAMLALQQIGAIPPGYRFAVSVVVICMVSLPVLRGKPAHILLSILVGLAVFAVWIGPDVLFPAWRHSILFDNSLLGHPNGSTPPDLRNSRAFLVPRIAISVIAVPVLEELFWRGWLMRWLIDPEDFERVPLGAYTPRSFWIVAILFASEHGPFWDVGLLAGIIYNAWMVRTRNLWDCILAHAVTNAALAAYVVLAGQWQYWL